VEPSGGAEGGFVDLAITERCNQRCIFCYEDTRGGPGELTLAAVKQLVDEAARTHDTVVLCGKEALLRPDILEVVAYAAGLGKHVVAFTNGQVLARPGFVEALVGAGLGGVVISFHFPDPEAFAQGARVRPQLFARVLKGMERVRDYNLAHPEAPVSVHVETDLFVWNQGRLAEMRATVREHLGPSFRQYTLGGMTPVRLPGVEERSLIEPFEARRVELADFLATQPPDVALRFTKTPLCLLPGHEHLSLDAQYALASTPIRHNLYQVGEVGGDDETLGASYEFDAAFQRNPYRWVCRSCRLVRLCRFRRTAWYAPQFLPTREQKPRAVHDRGPAEVLAALAAVEPSFAGRAVDVERLSRPVTTAPPEERLLAAFEAPGHDDLRLDEAWVDGRPFLTLELSGGAERARLWLTAPATDEQPLGFVVGCLDVVPTLLTPGAGPLVKKAVDRLARAALPPRADWEGQHGFHPHRARRLQAAWDRLGPWLWPGQAVAGGWRTHEARLTRAGVALRLAHAGGATAVLTYTPTPAAGETSLAREVLTLHAAGSGDAQTVELEPALRAAFTGCKVSTGLPPGARGRGIALLLVAEPAPAAEAP